MLHGLCFGEEAGARNLVFFRVKWLWPGEILEIGLLTALRAHGHAADPRAHGHTRNPRAHGHTGRREHEQSTSTRAPGHTDTQPNHSVAMCVDTCRFATWCCETQCNGCMNVAWGFVLGRKPEHETLCFSV